MIKIELLNNNNIVTLISENKIPIKSSGGLFHHSSIELLGCAIGACLGKTVVKYCASNNIDITNIVVSLDIDSNLVTIYINYSNKIKIDDLIKDLKNCDMIKLLNNSIKFEFKTNEIIINESKPKKKCCGE